MNIQPCARCQYGVYPAEKINCIDQTWHKACFHCEVCKMVLTVNNFVSHEKRPYCQAHNPKNNTFTSVFETPINMNVKKQSEAVSEIKYREEGEKFKSVFHWDMKSRHMEDARKVQLNSQKAYHDTYEESKSWFPDTIANSEMVGIAQAQNTLCDVKYQTEEEQQRGKGSFPALITPAYQIAKKATQLSSNVEYKRGHEDRVSKFTTVVDTPDILHAKFGGQLISDSRYTEDYEQQRGKGSFPAMITPAYQIAKRANELASDVKYHQRYEKEIKGKASHSDGASKENLDQFSQDYMDEYEEPRGKGSFPAMITPAYLNAKKANELSSDIKYKKDFSKMKGAAHYHSLSAQENLVLKQAQDVNKLYSEVEYKKDLENSKGHSINYCETPQFRNVSKISKYTSDLKYKEHYQNQKGHYEGVGMDRRTLHAMKVGSLASNIAYKSDYTHDDVGYNYPATLTPSYQTTRKLVPLKDVNYKQSIDKLKYSSVTCTPQMMQAKINAQQFSDVNYKQSIDKLKYSSVTCTPQLMQAKINAQQFSDLNYRAQYEKTKTQYTLPQDVPQLVKAKANAELYSEIKYKEGWEKSKGHGFEMTLDSMSLLAAKASRNLASDIVYKKDSEKNKAHFHLPMDMIHLKHAKKAQALASDLDYRKKIHEYTVVPEDLKTQWAKKAYGLQSELQYRTDLNWMRGVGWIADGSLNVEQAKKAGELVSEKKYRQKADALKFTSVADSSHIKHAKKSQELQSDVAYRSGKENFLHNYTISKDEPLFIQARINAANISEKIYKSSWEKQKEKGFELHLDAIPFLTAKAKRDLASDIKYKENYEKTRGKLIGVKGVSEDSQMAHLLHVSKLQSDLEYKRASEDIKNQYHVSLDMINLVHAKKAQDLATDRGYKTIMHRYTALPTDMKTEWAKWAYGLQSDNRYRADLNWMKGAGWIATGSLNVKQAKKAGELISEKKYRQHPYALKFTSIKDTPEMIQARISYNQAVDRLYKEHGENIKHHYTQTAELPEIFQAKQNALNISETRYKESWNKIRDGGYKLKLDAIPFQSAKASNEIISDYKYKEAFEKAKGQMIGSRGLEDINISHSVHAALLQSDVNYKKGFDHQKSQFHLPLDMVNLVHARKAQSLVSDQEYRQLLHDYTSLSEDVRLQCAKKAYNLQSENLYRSDLNFMRGVGCIVPGALEIEAKKKASELISESKYRQQPDSFKYTSVTDSPGLLHAKFSNMIANERLYKEAGENTLHHYTVTLGLPEFERAKMNAINVSEAKYRESWHNLRAQGYKLTMEAIPFQTAKASREIASDLQYKHNFVQERGKHIGARSILDDTNLLHCLYAAKLQSEQEYKKGFRDVRSQYHLPLDMVNLVHARKAQNLVSDQDYRMRLHDYTALPEDLRMKWAKRAHLLQSEFRYKSDLNVMKGLGWMALRSPQIENVKKAGELISETKYRQKPDSLKFTTVADSLDFIHAKNSYIQCNERLYRAGHLDSIHSYTLPPDHPDFIRARLNALHISDKLYKTSWEQTRAAGYDFRLDAIPFQTAKASREIASDFKYKESFLRDRGQQIGLRNVNEDPKMRHFLKMGHLQSDNQYKRDFIRNKAQFKSRIDQPGFIHAKKSQQLISDVNYRQHLHQYTCDPEQLNLKHAKQAYRLQSDVKYKSDLNWIKGIGWTPPGSYKVEMARRAAELANAQGNQGTLDQYDSENEQTSGDGSQQVRINPDAAEILQVKRRKMQPIRK
ncbi:nebulin-related-anchoring protein isoform X1 [Varanus komodoensis]|uniref:Nebulin related anchoring protein n=1 Tax=Varanus komodoensis TaxID=61221 RepID=A0A8D2IXQ3_VARKO|nr:nebulin-related-anchoring protein isoform X1 [Varanus komodoensis]